MASGALLLDLPNELFLFIFQYLRSIDILKAFSDIQSRRVQALIQPFLTQLDISQESNEWIQNYVSVLFIKHQINALRLQMKHLTFISEHLLSTNIQSMQVINWDFDFDFAEQVVSQLRRNLKKMLFAFPELGESSDIVSQLFQSDSQLEHLTIRDCVLVLCDNEIGTCTQLTYLSVELEGIHPVFILIKHLPNLQELKVKIISQECIVQPAPDINGIKPCKTLRSVTFTGWIKYFDHLESFFATFGSTIEYLSLRIHLMYFTVDGARLERALLNKMPRLSSLDLLIFSAVSDDEPIQIETFQSFTWQQLNPIVYWYDVHAQQHMIFTVPYTSDRFEYFSNDFVSTWISNRPISLYFERVRTLSFISTTPLKPETFLFIQQVFPNVTTVELTQWTTHPLLEIEEDEEEEIFRNFRFTSEDLLSDASLQMATVTKFRVNLWSQYLDYKTFRRFLCLFPNLVALELDIQGTFLHDLFKHPHEDALITTIFARIDQLKITSGDETDTLTDAEIHCLFPNVKSVVKL